MNKIVSVKNLRKSFRRNIKVSFFKDLFKPQVEVVDAVKNISFDISKGESVAFLGPNGAGKTTTIKMLTGLIYPTSGEVKVLGFVPFERNKEMLTRIGLVMGNKAGLNWDLTANQSFELLKYIYKIPSNEFEKRVDELATLLDAKNFLNTQIRRLSLGERMKMELIGSLIHKPEVLFLDEPTIGLDISSKQKIRGFLREIQKSGVTILLTSHDMDDIERVCDRVIVINNGVKVYDNSINKLIQKYSTYKYIKFIMNSENVELSVKGELIERKSNALTYRVRKEDMPKILAETVANVHLIDIDILPVPLEEIMSDIFRSSTKI